MVEGAACDFEKIPYRIGSLFLDYMTDGVMVPSWGPIII